MCKVFFLVGLVLACGCTSPFFMSVQGTLTSNGITVPSEEVLQLEALHYLNGEKVVVRDPASVTYKFKAAESNNYFGIVKTVAWRESDLTLTPTNRLESVVK